jgi:CRISPR-associated protein Csb2
MSSILLISVRFHEGRYHGMGDWPPSPARLFQALIAGAGLQGPLKEDHVKALEWLETMQPPLIAAPVVRKGQSVGNFVPNNDLDAVGGDPRRIGSIRAKKEIRPLLFDAEQPLLYAWTLRDESDKQKFASVLCQLAEKIYQLGRGIDLGWAWAEIIGETELTNWLDDYAGTVHHPSLAGAGKPVSCPIKGSFASLEARYVANQSRFEIIKTDRGAVSQNFRRLPKPKFQSVAYDSPPVQKLFELRSVIEPEQFQVWSLDRASLLIQSIRDAVFKRLVAAFPTRTAQVEHWLIGRNADGSNGGKANERIRLIPLASIGHAHADHGIRRVFIEAPVSCPIRADDLFWAFNGVELGEDGSLGRLSVAEDSSFIRHYGIGDAFADWQTITPAVLPESAKRRRIEPSRRVVEAKGASERAHEQHLARLAVLTALRHAGVNAEVRAIIVQREPFQSHGERAEAFAPGSRFSKERLWHVAVKFAEPVRGPLVFGDGRFLGLGSFAPCFPK